MVTGKQYIFRASASTPQEVKDYLEENTKSTSFPKLIEGLVISDMRGLRKSSKVESVDEVVSTDMVFPDSDVSFDQEALIEAIKKELNINNENMITRLSDGAAVKYDSVIDALNDAEKNIMDLLNKISDHGVIVENTVIGDENFVVKSLVNEQDVLIDDVSFRSDNELINDTDFDDESLSFLNQLLGDSSEVDGFDDVDDEFSFDFTSFDDSTKSDIVLNDFTVDSDDSDDSNNNDDDIDDELVGALKLLMF